MKDFSMGKLERLINANIQTQRQNHPDSEIATAARLENEKLFAECQSRGYVYDSSTNYLAIFESVEQYHLVTNTKKVS